MRRLFCQCFHWLAAVLLAWTAVRASGAEPFYLKPGDTVVFLGDSITFADGYLRYLDAYLFTRFPDNQYRLLNRGLPSETAAGTSEPSHIPPRPDVHTRFTRTVPPLAPTVLSICYGMNDGSYLAPNEPIFAKYRAGIERLIARGKSETSARLMVLTPPPFDPLPFTGKAPLDPPDYRRPAANYDDALAAFSDWLITLRSPELPVIDLHAPILQLLAERRRADPRYLLAGDGIHLNSTGHLLVALEILKAWRAPAEIQQIEIDAAAFENQPHLNTTVHLRLPMPADPSWDKPSVQLAQFNARVNRLPVKLANLPARFRGPDPAVFDATLQIEGSNLRATTPLSAEGGELFPAFEKLANPQAQQILALVQKRRQLLLELWVRDDPHPRLEGMHKKSTASQAEIDQLEAQIRQLGRPIAVSLKLTPSAQK